MRKPVGKPAANDRHSGATTAAPTRDDLLERTDSERADSLAIGSPKRSVSTVKGREQYRMPRGTASRTPRVRSDGSAYRDEQS